MKSSGGFSPALLNDVGEIRDIVWVNPERMEEEEPLVWLQNGAPPEDRRQLRAWGYIRP